MSNNHDQWTHSGRLENGQPFWFAVKPGTEREVAQGGRTWRVAEGSAAFPTDWATRGVVSAALPKGERLVTNSPELAETILEPSQTRLQSQTETPASAPLTTLFGPKVADGLSPSALLTAAALTALGFWAARQKNGAG